MGYTDWHLPVRSSLSSIILYNVIADAPSICYLIVFCSSGVFPTFALPLLSPVLVLPCPLPYSPTLPFTLTIPGLSLLRPSRFLWGFPIGQICLVSPLSRSSPVSVSGSASLVFKVPFLPLLVRSYGIIISCGANLCLTHVLTNAVLVLFFKVRIG